MSLLEAVTFNFNPCESV